MSSRYNNVIYIFILSLLTGCVQTYESFPIDPPQPVSRSRDAKSNTISDTLPPGNAEIISKDTIKGSCAVIRESWVEVCGPDPSSDKCFCLRNPGIDLKSKNKNPSPSPPHQLTGWNQSDSDFICLIVKGIGKIPAVGGFRLLDKIATHEANIVVATKSAVFKFPVNDGDRKAFSMLTCNLEDAEISQIFVEKTHESVDNSPRFCFIYPTRSFCPSAFESFSPENTITLVVTTKYETEDLVPIIDATLETRSINHAFEINEIIKSIVHESIHLYAQNSVFIADKKVRKTQVSHLGSRHAIEKLFASDINYYENVRKEFCSISTEFRNDINNPSQGRNRIRTILSHISQRDFLFGSGNAERFWYFVEGIPMYIEQLVDDNRNEKLVSTVRLVCEGEKRVFFPLYTGAVLAASLDQLTDQPACLRWREKISLDHIGVDQWFKILEGCAVARS
jgi:hypothetical protein